MSVLITNTARLQYRGMVSRYLQPLPHRPARPDAARRLIETCDEAVRQIEAGPPHPRPYPALVEYGFRWIKI